MKKRILSALLCLCMVVCMMPAVSFAIETTGTCGKYGGNNVTWSLSNDGTLTISGTGEMQDYNNYTGTPWYDNRWMIKTIVIGNGVTNIGNCALQNCFSLTSVTIGNDVTNIDNFAFSGCDKLTNINVSGQNKDYSSADGVLFDKNKTTLILCPDGKSGSYTVPNSVTSIGASAFSNCANLTQVTIADSVQKIDAYAFRNCTALKSVAMPKTLQLHGLGTSAFEGCSSLESISVPAGIDSILPQTFYGCSSLTNVTLPDGLAEIDNCAFMDCTSLKQLTLPMSTTHFGDCAFGFEQSADGSSKKIDGFKISTHTKGAEEYCEKNGIAYEITHKWVTIPGKAATCTATGLTEGVRCEICNQIQTEQTDIPKLEHKYTNYVYNNDAQVGQDGTETAKCDYGCGSSKTRTKEGSALPEPDEPSVLPTVTFYDIEQGSYYESAVWWAVSKEITNGTSDTTFSPNATCTRAQIVTFLWRAKGRPEPTSDYNPFYDVSSDAYYYKAVLWAVEQGITNGTSASTFSPNAGCTRGQVVTFLWRAEGEPYSGASNIFADVNTSEYYGTAVLWAVENGITNGTGANTFSPNMTCTRGQIVTFLYRCMA